MEICCRERCLASSYYLTFFTVSGAICRTTVANGTLRRLFNLTYFGVSGFVYRIASAGTGAVFILAATSSILNSFFILHLSGSRE